MARRTSSSAPRRIRYAVAGLGHIAQAAILPAFRHARRNSQLAALISDDPTKLKTLSRKYNVRAAYGYDDFEAALEQCDAVFIALPNSMHAEFTVRAARRGVWSKHLRRPSSRRTAESCSTRRTARSIAYALRRTRCAIRWIAV